MSVNSHHLDHITEETKMKREGEKFQSISGNSENRYPTFILLCLSYCFLSFRVVSITLSHRNHIKERSGTSAREERNSDIFLGKGWRRTWNHPLFGSVWLCLIAFSKAWHHWNHIIGKGRQKGGGKACYFVGKSADISFVSCTVVFSYLCLSLYTLSCLHY